MSGSLGSSKSDSSANNAFNQQVWGGQSDALQNMYGQVGNMFSQGKGGMADQSQLGQQFSQDTMANMQQPWQNQMQGGAYSGMDLTGAMNQSIADMQGGGTTNMQDINAMIMGGAGNNYADAMRAQYMQDAGQAQDLMMGNLDARAAASGMSGGSRHGVAEAQGMQDINQNLQSAMAQTGYETFSQDLDRKLAIAQAADANQLARATQNQNTIMQMMGGQQGAMSGGMGFGQNMMNMGGQQQMMPWQQAGAYSNILGAPTVLGAGTGQSAGSSKGTSVSGGAK